MTVIHSIKLYFILLAEPIYRSKNLKIVLNNCRLNAMLYKMLFVSPNFQTFPEIPVHLWEFWKLKFLELIPKTYIFWNNQS